MPSEPLRLFFLVGPVLDNHRRSGVQRVVVETARRLASQTNFTPVRYDASIGGLRPLDVAELNSLFGAGDWPEGMAPDRRARRLGVPFRTGREPALGAWLLVPEVPWVTPHGTEQMARAISQCRAWGVRAAAIFYDLIPLENRDYLAYAPQHAEYVAHLARTDLVLAISEFSAEKLRARWRSQGVDDPPAVAALPLPTGGFGYGRAGDKDAPPRDGPVALIGTVEPRKRQLAFLCAYAAARRRSAGAAKRDVLLCGSLHPDIADAVNAFVASNTWASRIDFASEARVARAYAEAPFTAFASEDEGFGLPIAESLAAGAPCLCADFGAMAEVAAGGGSLMVDVRDPLALEQAIVDLFEDPALLPRLSREIVARRFSGWDDYVADLTARLSAHAELKPKPAQVVPVGLGDDRPDRLQDVDVLAFASASARDVFLVEGAGHEPGLLPQLAAGAEELTAAVAAIETNRGLRASVAKTERAYAQARRADVRRSAHNPVRLRLLISTRNRRDFVVTNVRWLLKEVMPAKDATIDLVVFDGASDDGSVDALREIGDPRLTVIENPEDAGMLGGWREASKLQGAEYLWVVGDDDFIKPEGLRAVLQRLDQDPGLPLGFVNFELYHRPAWVRGEGPRDLLAQSQTMTSSAAPTGRIAVARAAEQHDNLFTAIYAIVWRADVFATAYDHAFDGGPFIDMIESIPCTEAILRLYGDCEAWWVTEPAIAANAFNGWSRHRPRWHGVVMPQALALAREVGVDPVRLQAWADLQYDLYQEGLAIARERGVDSGLTPEILAPSQRVFRRDAARDLA